MIRYAGFLTDEKTGLPLPIAPRANLPPRQPRSPNLERVADLHHPAEGNRKLCNGSESDQALRHSRMQWALYDDHHTGIHGNKLKPVLPTGIAARFR